MFVWFTVYILTCLWTAAPVQLVFMYRSNILEVKLIKVSIQ